MRFRFVSLLTSRGFFSPERGIFWALHIKKILEQPLKLMYVQLTLAMCFCCRPNISKQTTKKKARILLIGQLVKKFSINGKIQCRKCLRKIQVQADSCGKPKSDNQMVTQHSFIHLNKNLFACLRCGEKEKNYWGIANHIRYCHHLTLKSASAFIINRSDSYHEELMANFSECYDRDKETGGPSLEKATGQRDRLPIKTR